MNQAFLEECKKNLNHEQWGGLHESSLAYTLIQGCKRDPNMGPFWIICPTENHCENLIATLLFFRSFCDSNTDIGHYPQDDPRTFDGASPAPEYPRKRMYARSILQKNNSIVVSSVFGALHQSLSSTDLKTQTLNLQENQEYSKEDILDKLHAIGYRAETPHEEGSYIFRGDTLLIWPNGSSSPYRISFFDEEVESIHRVSSKTRRKTSSVSNVSIIPCKEAIITPHSLRRLGRHLQRQQRTHPKRKQDALHIRQELSQGFWFPGAEDYLPCMWDLVSPLTEASKVFLLSPIEVNEKCAYWDQILERRWNHLDEEEKPLIEPSLRYAKSTIVANKNSISVQELQGEGLFFGTKRPPNLSLANNALQEQLCSWLEEDWEVVLVTSSEHQQSKIRHVLRDIPFQKIQLISEIQTGAIQSVRGNILEGYIDPIQRRALLCANDLLPNPISQRKKTLREATLQSHTDLKIGDYVVHKTHGIGRFVDLTSMVVRGQPIECLEIEYQAQASIMVPLNRMDQLYRYRAIGKKEPKIDKLGGKSWQSKMTRVKKKVLDMAHKLIRIHAKRAAATGYKYDTEHPLINKFSATFPYEETHDQAVSITEILEDLSKATQMDRLLIGDVGFGKTEVAMRAAICVAAANHQVALLCPTTILAMQHYRTVKKRFSPFNIEVALVSRLQTPKEVKEIYKKLAAGEIHILIGTHALLNKRIQFHHLGLVIADEEHRFGVVQKEKLRALSQVNLKYPAKYLAMSATPIPRTLHMAFSGIRDVSIIATPPPGRQPVETLTIHESDAKIQQQIQRELKRGGQVFFVHNRVESLPSRVKYLEKLVPEARICFAHGQQDKKRLEQTMLGFIKNQYNVLVCTSIIENGVDLPNANTIIIDQAQQLGLAQLYQLRGRVGRSSAKAYCTFVIPKKGIKRNALARLHTLQRHTDLSSGFAVASADLELRGSGNLLGKEQSGHIQVVGLDIYIELLEQSVRELQGKNDLQYIEPEVEIPVSGSLPENYIPDTEERLREYQKISSVHTHDDLRNLTSKWVYAYGDLPEETTKLVWFAESQIWCRILGIQKLHWLKSRVLIMLHRYHNLNLHSIDLLCKKYPARIKKKETPSGFELYAYFRTEEADNPFGFLFWFFQEIRLCLAKKESIKNS